MFPVQDYQSISRSTLEDAERRAVTFLKAAGPNARIRGMLEAAGYSKKVHAEGFRLYFKVVGYSPTIDVPLENAAQSAFATLEAWEASGFARARAALRHNHPEVEPFIFAGLSAVRGPEALGAMATFLDRCDALESAPERKATRKSDKAALATLEERGITRALRDDLRAKLELATVDAEAGTLAEAAPADVLQRKKDLHALYLWIQDWTETARAVIPSRADLIRLGIAKRRRTAKPAPVGAAVGATPAVAVAVVAAVAPASPAMIQKQAEDDVGPASRAA